MPKYTLSYFNARGRGEIARLVLAASGISYTDKRIEFQDWPTTKTTTPLGQLPYLEVDNVVLPQHLTISRYLAKEGNIAGKTNLEQAQADAIVDTALDGFNAFLTKVFYVKEPAAKEEAVKKFNEEELPKHLGNLEKLISLYGKNGFSVGSSLTWADLQIYHVFSSFFSKDSSLTTKFAKVYATIKSVENDPKVSVYLKQRPEAVF